MPSTRPKKGQPGIQPSVDELAIQREQDRRVLDLALSGKNGVQIAAELGIDKSTVTRTLQKVWARTEQPRAEELRSKWDMRIEAGIAAIWEKYLDGDIAAVNAFVRLAERAAKMHALDQQASKDAGALAEALLADPETRAQKAFQLRDELAALRAQHEADAAGG